MTHFWACEFTPLRAGASLLAAALAVGTLGATDPAFARVRGNQAIRAEVDSPIEWATAATGWMKFERPSVRLQPGFRGAPGDECEVEWRGKWYPAVVLKNDGVKHFITYEGYDDSWDEWVGDGRIRSRAPRPPGAE
ncbi:MAG TPA: Tudor-knot domain-containing protein [Pirellulales bacterium]